MLEILRESHHTELILKSSKIPGKEHWIGLDSIYKLTNRRNVTMQLMIILEQYYLGLNATVMYDDFSLEDEVQLLLPL